MSQFDDFLSFTDTWWTWNVNSICCACLRPAEAACYGMQVSLTHYSLTQCLELNLRYGKKIPVNKNTWDIHHYFCRDPSNNCPQREKHWLRERKHWGWGTFGNHDDVVLYLCCLEMYCMDVFVTWKEYWSSTLQYWNITLWYRVVLA